MDSLTADLSLLRPRNKRHHAQEEESEDSKRFELDVEENEEAAAAAIEGFRNNVVTEKIFGYLSISDLFNCSLVSRTWRIHCRAALRKRCLLSIHLDKHSPCEIEELANLLEKSPAVPFSGLSLTCSYTWPSGYNDGYSYSKFQDVWDHLANILVAKVTSFSTLKLDCGDSWDDVAERLIGRIFPHVYEQLETIRWKGQISSASRLLRGHRSLKKLCRLRDFEFSGASNSPSPDKLAQRIIYSSPNLRKLKGFVTPSWLTGDILPCQDLSWIKEFACDFTPDTLAAANAFAKQKPKLRRLHISPFASPPQNTISWCADSKRIIKKITSCLFKSSCETLCELIIVQDDLVQLLTREARNSCVCNQLQSLTLCASRRFATEHEIPLLHLNYALSFPKLKRIEIHMFEPVSSAEDFPTMGPCLTVTTIELENTWAYMGVPTASKSLLLNLAIKFPFVRHLSVKSLGRVGVDSFADKLWEAWPLLETLTLTGMYLSSLKNWDAALCGISVEEAASLISFSSEELARFQFASVRPSLLNLDYLKTLRLEVLHNQVNHASRENPAEFVISKVSGLCVLNRMPGLVVELYPVGRFNVKNECRFKLDHLSSLVTVKHENLPYASIESYRELVC